MQGNAEIARGLVEDIRRIPGAVDVAVRQVRNVPSYYLEIDRVRALQIGVTPQDAANALLSALGAAGTVSPSFWSDPTAGLSYTVQVVAPPSALTSLEQLLNTPVKPAGGAQAVPLRTFASLQLRQLPANIDRTTLQPTQTVLANVAGRDLGGVYSEVAQLIEAAKAKLKPGNRIEVAGRAQSMSQAYGEMAGGLALAAVLVYLVMVVNFQSWLMPIIAMSGLPVAITGAAIGALRHRDAAVGAGADGLHHGHRCFDRQQRAGDQLRARPAAAWRDASGGGARSGADATAPRAHDRDGDDRRHPADGHRPRRGRRAERAARPRRCRRAHLRHLRDARLSCRSCSPCWRGRRNIRNSKPNLLRLRRRSLPTSRRNEDLTYDFALDRDPRLDARRRGPVAGGPCGAFQLACRRRARLLKVLRKASPRRAPCVWWPPEPATAAGKLTLSGRTAPAEQALVSARATGVVAERKVDIGDRVEAGDVLLTIEAPEIEHELNRARAALQQVRARLEIAKLNSARADQLTPKGFLSEQVRDERRASLQTAEADIAAAEAEVKRLEEVQGFQTVRAPFMGTIVARQVERGDKISGDQSQQGSFLFRIARLDPLRVEIDVPQSSALKIKPQDKARVTFAELPGEIFEAEVARMSHLIDQASSTMRAELMMPNPGRRIPAGLNGQVLFSLARDNTTVTVPSNTLAVRDGRQMVAVVDAQSRVEFQAHRGGP